MITDTDSKQIQLQLMQINSKFTRHRSAFTLVELLVVIVIVAALATVTLVAVRTIRSKANAAKSASNIKQIYDGHMLYVSEYGHFPSGNDRTSKIFAEQLVDCAHWVDRLAPYVGLGQDLEETRERFVVGELPPGIFNVPGRKRLDEGEGQYRSGYVRNHKIYLNDDTVGQGQSFKTLASFSRLSATYFLIDTGGESPNTDYDGWQISSAARLKWPAHGGTTGKLNGNVVACFLDGHVESPKKGDLPSNYKDVFWSAPTN